MVSNLIVLLEVSCQLVFVEKRGTNEYIPRGKISRIQPFLFVRSHLTGQRSSLLIIAPQGMASRGNQPLWGAYGTTKSIVTKFILLDTLRNSLFLLAKENIFSSL